jgi:hypothetical protein
MFLQIIPGFYHSNVPDLIVVILSKRIRASLRFLFKAAADGDNVSKHSFHFFEMLAKHLAFQGDAVDGHF